MTQAVGRVVIDARVLEGPLTGIARATQTLLQGFVEAGHAPRVMLLVGPGEEAESRIPFLDRFQLAKVPWKLRHLDNVRRLPRWLSQQGAVLYHCPDAWLVPRVLPCPSLITLHDVIPLTHRQWMRRHKKAKFAWLWRGWLRGQARFCQTVVTDSRFSRDAIARELSVESSRIAVVPLGLHDLSPEAASLEVPREVGRLLYVGRRDPYKQLPMLIETVGRLRETGQELTLTVIGDRDSRYPDAERMVQGSSLAGHVEFLGRVEDGELHRWYRRAGALVLPSRVEGFGLPVLEAMREGCPVICSRAGSLPEVVGGEYDSGGAAVLVDPDDGAGWFSAIQGMLQDHARRKTCSARGIQRARGFTPRRQAEATWRVYEQAMAEPPQDHGRRRA